MQLKKEHFETLQAVKDKKPLDGRYLRTLYSAGLVMDVKTTKVVSVPTLTANGKKILNGY